MEEMIAAEAAGHVAAFELHLTDGAFSVCALISDHWAVRVVIARRWGRSGMVRPKEALAASLAFEATLPAGLLDSPDVCHYPLIPNTLWAGINNFDICGQDFMAIRE